ncbi:hypothetical protein HZZ00_38045 (plasmid) [Streptomyces sp. NEAU-sy36]|uniref:hypothetical protein n=1 Tax=unclassified Streptomyces TaxID=2593676 RepID=UPI0015D6327D|nr:MULTISPECIES: hypothetical protein [unclassified Streptomyces]QLJ06834.1 hypothetical protein HZZ00_38045 [Streptomyces sp. NEAU-sy36]
MKQTTKTQTVMWAITILLTARLIYAAIQHHLAVLDTAAIALTASYGFKAALENVTTSICRARTGGTR